VVKLCNRFNLIYFYLKRVDLPFIHIMMLKKRVKIDIVDFREI
jgi:hypothetical protein